MFILLEGNETHRIRFGPSENDGGHFPGKNVVVIAGPPVSPRTMVGLGDIRFRKIFGNDLTGH
jgi:hypothetical protein